MYALTLLLFGQAMTRPRAVSVGAVPAFVGYGGKLIQV